jgi:hypothetical protein
MGRPKPVRGPIAFMPSDGKFLGSGDLRGLPIQPDGSRITIRVVEVVEYPAGEVICGRKNAKAFWAMRFETPCSTGWRPGRKEWKIGPVVARRLALRLGDDTQRWRGALVPITFEATTFGNDDVWGVRPVPLPWESDRQRKREAMDAIAAGTYEPPGLPKSDKAPPTPERQPGEDDEPPPSDEDTTEPPDGWKPGEAP